MKRAERDLILLSSKQFYLITNYYEPYTYDEI